MKKYDELTDAEKVKAFDNGFRQIMESISEAPFTFPDLEQEINKASDIAEKNRTPWFFGEVLYHEVPGAKEKINAIIQDHLENALYPEAGEYVIYL